MHRKTSKTALVITHFDSKVEYSLRSFGHSRFSWPEVRGRSESLFLPFADKEHGGRIATVLESVEEDAVCDRIIIWLDYVEAFARSLCRREGGF